MSTFYPGFAPVWLLAAMLLAGCGQKGALYLPEQKPQVSTTQQNPPSEPQAPASPQNPTQKP
ncbi:MAG: lipoprotein [Gammaproteobacteria bacterium]|nr:lipoprotein [Gammaproteobacteria bacterium]